MSVKINMFVLGTFLSSSLHLNDMKSACVVVFIIFGTWRSSLITLAFSRSQPLNCQFENNHHGILNIWSSRPLQGPNMGFGHCNHRSRVKIVHPCCASSKLRYGPNMVGFGIASIKRNLFPMKRSTFIRLVLCSKRTSLIGLAPIIYIW